MSAPASTAEEDRSAQPISRERFAAARDDERRRVARDLHDGAQQQLLAVCLALDLAAERTVDPELQASLLAMRAKVDEAIEGIRDIARGLGPPVLAQRGLEEALRAATTRSSPHVAVRCRGLRRYPAAVERAVYFTCVEAVQNAVRHARPSRLLVDLQDDERRLAFVVRDDGCGFDAVSCAAGVGFESIAERVHAVGGRVAVRSVAGHGTTVTGEIPLRAARRRRPGLAATS